MIGYEVYTHPDTGRDISNIAYFHLIGDDVSSSLQQPIIRTGSSLESKTE